MSSPWQQPDAPSLCAPRAAGHGEVWRDWDADATFRQYGWRRGTGEDAYSPATLVGNWAEERRDTRALARRRPLPSQVGQVWALPPGSLTILRRRIPPRMTEADSPPRVILVQRGNPAASRDTSLSWIPCTQSPSPTPATGTTSETQPHTCRRREGRRQGSRVIAHRAPPAGGVPDR
ncbi:cilia- and flagella-associated protein 68 isoform X1 [Lepisosteus oculatus]|uniref:cilia- and flagella-associated protein 68 isoform X1 n=1 Tax=Lepisosteus oculatus TaxID=7918 RepID=UPI0037157258